jgi:hypothetical protein
VSGKLPVRRLVRVKASEDVTLTRPLNSPLVQHFREPRRGQRKRRGRGSALSRKPSNKSPSPESFSPYLCPKCRQPGHYRHDCPNHQHQVQNLGAAKCAQDKHSSIQGEPDQINSMANTSIPESFLTSPCNFESRDEILLKGGRL